VRRRHGEAPREVDAVRRRPGQAGILLRTWAQPDNIISISAWTLVTTVAPQAYVASIGGMQNAGGYIGASVAPVVTGLIVEGTGGFVVGSGIAMASPCCYAFLVRNPIWERDLLKAL
jgi:hypothetical protein